MQKRYISHSLNFPGAGEIEPKEETNVRTTPTRVAGTSLNYAVRQTLNVGDWTYASQVLNG